MASLIIDPVFERDIVNVKKKKKFNLKQLRISLKYRPNIYKLILKMRHCIRKKNLVIISLQKRIKDMDKTINEKKDSFVQTENKTSSTILNGDTLSKKDIIKKDSQPDVACLQKLENTLQMKDESGWDIRNDDEKTMSIADQVKEVAQSALQESGMVYVESAGMYYDYKTGYYYNSELGLYYHTDTECYYYYSDEKKSFVFHSYPDRSAMAANAALTAHERKKAKKHKKDWKTENDIDNLTKNLSQGKEENTSNQESQPKRRKTDKKKKRSKGEGSPATKRSETKEDIKSDADNKDDKTMEEGKFEPNKEEKGVEELDSKDKKAKEEIVDKEKEIDTKDDEMKVENRNESLEDGECSESSSDESEVKEMSDTSTSTASDDDDDAVAKHHPPCMRVIVKETNLPKLKVGSLYLVTKDGGTIGREGEQHAILLRDHNVSRNHLDIRYDLSSKIYVAMDLGSKNGTILNGLRMSESQVVSKPMEVLHGSILQLGETKLLCHIHPGKDTCGHCEPGLLMETQEKEKKAAYTRTCSVQKQHQLELARLKNKYAPQPKAIEETAYNDRAQARRTTVGSSHHSEKTQSTDVGTFIAPENKGFKLLEKMGWSKGEGLGKDSQGDTEPIPLVSNEGKSGLGATASAPALYKASNTLGPATLRLASRTKMLKPPAKAFQAEDDEDLEEE